VRILAAALLAIGVLGLVPTSVGAHAGSPAVNSRAMPAEARNVRAGVFVYERVTKTARWLEARDLSGGSRVALTRRPTPGEIRRDCCASWSPDGTEVAFFRRTPKQLGLYVVSADGSQVRRLVSASQLKRWIGRPISLASRIWWSGEASKLLFTVDDLQHGCNSDGIYRVSTDGSNLRPLWRRPPKLLASAYAFGWSPDGTAALFDVSENDGDCYGSHIGPETLMTVPDRAGAQPSKLVTGEIFGGARWSPDGAQIAYSICVEGTPCNLAVIDPKTRKARLVTRYKTYTSPFGGFDELPFLWSEDGDLVLGRFLSLLALDVTDGRTHRIVTTPCPRGNSHCPKTSMTLYGISQDGDVIFDTEDVGCIGCPRLVLAPEPLSKRYVASLTDKHLAPLPEPGLRVDDVYLP